MWLCCDATQTAVWSMGTVSWLLSSLLWCGHQGQGRARSDHWPLIVIHVGGEHLMSRPSISPPSWSTNVSTHSHHNIAQGVITTQIECHQCPVLSTRKVPPLTYPQILQKLLVAYYQKTWDKHKRSLPRSRVWLEELSLFYFFVTSDIYPELLSCANGLRF